MNVCQQEKTPQEKVEAIFALDLDPIKIKLMDAREGQGWSRDEVDWYELQYRRFLTLMARYPDEVIVPDTNVDKFWHAHILDTMKYADDCQQVFGHFVHHFPYFGLRGEEDAANLSQAAQNTTHLYQMEFGGVQAPVDACFKRDTNARTVADAAAKAAHCGVAKAAHCGVAKAAHCGVAKAAHCGVAKAAHCGVAKAAHCGVAKAAHCGVAKAAHCGVAKAAHCGVAKAAHCGIPVGKSNADDIVTAMGRPSLDCVPAA